jgi:hypothetical protein
MEPGWFALVLFAFATGWLAERVLPWWARGLRLAAGPIVIVAAAFAIRLLHVSAAYIVLAVIFAVAFGWSWAHSAALGVLERHPR